MDHTIPKVRRCMLMGDSTSGESFDSFPYRVATIYLQQKGNSPQPELGDSNSFRLGKVHGSALFNPTMGINVGAEGGWQILLDFKCPDNFMRFSVTDALSGRIPPGILRDKIIIGGHEHPERFRRKSHSGHRNQRAWTCKQAQSTNSCDKR